MLCINAFYKRRPSVADGLTHIFCDTETWFQGELGLNVYSPNFSDIEKDGIKYFKVFKNGQKKINKIHPL